MIIKYIGHACFKVRDSETGYSIVFDPYAPESVPGLGSIRDTASEVLCSHDHFDHNYSDAVILEPQEESPFDVQYIDTWHDPKKGALRGPNRIHIITDRKTGEKLIHYGDIGEVMGDLLTPENLALLQGADVALIPVGGTYTYDADEALELIRRTSPKIAVPMHFKTKTGYFGFDNIGSIEDFLDKAAASGNKICHTSYSFYDTQGADPGKCVFAIRPQNIK